MSQCLTLIVILSCDRQGRGCPSILPAGWKLSVVSLCRVVIWYFICKGKWLLLYSYRWFIFSNVYNTTCSVIFMFSYYGRRCVAESIIIDINVWLNLLFVTIFTFCTWKHDLTFHIDSMSEEDHRMTQLKCCCSNIYIKKKNDFNYLKNSWKYDSC